MVGKGVAGVAEAAAAAAITSQALSHIKVIVNIRQRNVGWSNIYLRIEVKRSVMHVSVLLERDRDPASPFT